MPKYTIDPPPPRRNQAAPPSLPLVISIEGNIGVGKSTVMEALQKKYANRPDVAFLPEPVEEWREQGFLKRVYEDGRVLCAFQHMTLMSLAGGLMAALARDPVPKYIISERSPWGSYHAFAKVNLDGEDLKMYEFTWGRVIAALPAALKIRFLWLTTNGDVNTLVTRMATRDREEEVKNVKSHYLKLLEDAHGAWLADHPDHTPIDALQEPGEVVADALKKLEEWMGGGVE